jgi:hypothetical protein
VANSKKLNLIECGAPTIEFEPEIETGTEQVILLKSGDGSLIQDFNVLLTYPDKTTRLLQAIQGMLVLPIDKVGKYTAILQTNGFEQTIGFEAKAPGQIVPPINPGAEPMVTAVFGAETVYAPNYLIIWILAIAVISGFIIEVTKLRPGWFRVFMAITYTTLPLVVNYYTKNVELAFAIISLQTTILTMLWFRKWKARRALESLKALETKLQPITSAIKSEAPAVSKQQPQGTEKKEAPAGQKPEGNGKQGGTGGQQPIENIENSTFPGNREF